MPRPLTKPHRIEVRLSNEEHAELTAMAQGAHLAPTVVRLALGWRPTGLGGETRTRPAPTWREALDALEAHAARMRGSSPWAATAIKQVSDLRTTLEKP